MLRYSDILLMIAEAENEINNAPTLLAYSCLDAVRSRAKIKALTGSGLTKEQFRDVIKKERAMELCFEATRRFDLIRWGDYLKAMNDVALLLHNNPRWPVAIDYAASYFKIASNYYYLPIPASELAVNKTMLYNNPGW